MAAEVRVAPEILTLLEQDEIPFLGEMDGERIVLLEFPHSHIPPGAEKLVDLLLAQKIRPLIGCSLISRRSSLSRTARQ